MFFLTATALYAMIPETYTLLRERPWVAYNIEAALEVGNYNSGSTYTWQPSQRSIILYQRVLGSDEPCPWATYLDPKVDNYQIQPYDSSKTCDLPNDHTPVHVVNYTNDRAEQDFVGNSSGLYFKRNRNMDIFVSKYSYAVPGYANPWSWPMFLP